MQEICNRSKVIRRKQPHHRAFAVAVRCYSRRYATAAALVCAIAALLLAPADSAAQEGADSPITHTDIVNVHIEYKGIWDPCFLTETSDLGQCGGWRANWIDGSHVLHPYEGEWARYRITLRGSDGVILDLDDADDKQALQDFHGATLKYRFNGVTLSNPAYYKPVFRWHREIKEDFDPSAAEGFAVSRNHGQIGFVTGSSAEGFADTVFDTDVQRPWRAEVHQESQ